MKIQLTKQDKIIVDMKIEKPKTPIEKVADKVEVILRNYDNPQQNLATLYTMLDAVRKEILAFKCSDYNF